VNKFSFLDPPRAVYAAFDVFPRPKGSSSHIDSMVAALARRRAPVWLLCLGYGDMPACQPEGDVVVFRCKMYHPNMLRRAEEFMSFVAERTAVAAGGGALELVAFRDPWGGIPALRESAGAPSVFEVNALPSWELPYTYPEVKGNFALLEKLRDMELFCLREADAVLTVSGVTSEALATLGIGEEKITAVANSAADEFFEGRGAPCPLPELEEGRWFGYAGSLQPWQGVPLAVEAFRMIADDAPDARMLVVHNGRKEPAKELRKRIKRAGLEGRVLVSGPMAPPQLAAALARMTFTVAPLAETARNTVQGCCPVKIIESMAAGAPVIASDLRVCRGLVSHEKDGLLAPPGDTRSWAISMRRLFADAALAAKLSREARRTAKLRFTRPAAHDKLEQVFDKAIEGRA